MPNYMYIAKDNKGSSLKGVLEASSRQDAINIINAKGLLLISLGEAKERYAGRTQYHLQKKVKLDDLVVFSRQLATMVEAGIPLVAALDILVQQIEKSEFKKIVSEVRDRVEAGESLSDALTKYKIVFSELFVNMVKAGESSGMLDEILNRVASYMEKMNNLQRKVKVALIYPTVVITMAIGVTVILLVKVIPVFKEVYASFEAELPKPTTILIGISDLLAKYGFFVIAVMVIVSFILKRYFRTDKARLGLDRLLLDMPIFGILLKKVAVSKFTRTLSTLLKSGVSILSSLEIVSKTAGNKAIEDALDKVRTSVRQGENIAEPIARSKIFPPMVIKMIAVGERSGKLEIMLSKIADFYDEQVEIAISGLTSLIEPLIIVFLGVVIGSIVICMFLPIFNITALIK